MKIRRAYGIVILEVIHLLQVIDVHPYKAHQQLVEILLDIVVRDILRYRKLGEEYLLSGLYGQDLLNYF